MTMSLLASVELFLFVMFFSESIVESSAEILFDRLMLLELRGNVSKLDPKCYAELRSYNEPPETIANIMRSVLAMFYPEKALEGEFEAWSNCRQVKRCLQLSISCTNIREFY